MLYKNVINKSLKCEGGCLVAQVPLGWSWTHCFQACHSWGFVTLAHWSSISASANIPFAILITYGVTIVPNWLWMVSAFCDEKDSLILWSAYDLFGNSGGSRHDVLSSWLWDLLWHTVILTMDCGKHTFCFSASFKLHHQRPWHRSSLQLFAFLFVIYKATAHLNLA